MEDLIKYRRELHKYPEVSWHEIRTSARIAEILNDMGYENIKMGTEVVEVSAISPELLVSEDERKEDMVRAVKQGANPIFVDRTEGFPGVIVEYSKGIPGPVTALRFDIDALPYDEPQDENHRPFREGFASVNEKAIHACGHDAHVAMGLGLAQRLIKEKIEIKGTVRMIFQPAEETFCGALAIVEKGHLNDVDYFIAAHVAQCAEGVQMTSGAMCCSCNDFLSDCQWDVYFEGQAAHPCGASQDGKNAVLAACAATLNLHCIAPHQEGMFRVNVGEIHGGVCGNTIAPNAMIRVDFRGQNSNISEYARKRVSEVIEGAANMYDVDVKIVDYGEVPVAKSDELMAEMMERAAKKVPWFQIFYKEGGVDGTDDATCMMNCVQARGGVATYMGIGTDAPDQVHGVWFDIDESCLQAGVDLFFSAIEEIHE